MGESSEKVSIITRKLSKPINFLATEFVIIVLGVFAALAVDEWRESVREADIRSHLVKGLVSDLNGDAVDYQEFIEDSKSRGIAAHQLTQWSKNIEAGFDENLARTYIHRIGRSSRLETVLSTFNEITSTGTGSVIKDPELRLKISNHYGLAIDRADLNEMVYSSIIRYRVALEDIGFSFVDRDTIDVEKVLRNRKIMAIVRECGSLARNMPRNVDDLLESNQALISEFKQL